MNFQVQELLVYHSYYKTVIIAIETIAIWGISKQGY